MDNLQLYGFLDRSELASILNDHASEFGNGPFEFRDYPQLQKFAELIQEAEREACCTLLEGMHEAQRGNQNHNYHAYAAIGIRKLRKEK